MTERDLMLALRAVGERVETAEPSVDLSAAVRSRLARPSPAARTRRRLAAAVIATALLVSATAAATPALRDTVRGWLGGNDVEVRFVDRLPPTVSSARLDELGLGAEIAWPYAERSLPDSLPRVEALGRPDRVFLAVAEGTPIVTQLWHARDGLTPTAAPLAVGALLSVRPTRDRADPWWVGKVVAPGSRVGFTHLDISGGIDAVWIEGAPHAVTGLGQRRETFRLAANVLIWRLADSVYRLESALDRRTAVAIAESLERRAAQG